MDLSVWPSVLKRFCPQGPFAPRAVVASKSARIWILIPNNLVLSGLCIPTESRPMVKLKGQPPKSRNRRHISTLFSPYAGCASKKPKPDSFAKPSQVKCRRNRFIVLPILSAKVALTAFNALRCDALATACS